MSPKNNDSIKISFPVRWVAIFALPLFGLGTLQVYTTGAQADVVERAILIHGQEKHRAAASATDMQEVKFVQEDLGRDVSELHIIVKELTDNMNELIVELRLLRRPN